MVEIGRSRTANIQSIDSRIMKMPDFVREHYKNIVLKQPSTITLAGGEGTSYSDGVFRPHSRGYKCKKRYTN